MLCRVNRTLVCVYAHPDDDAYGIAPTVALHTDDPDFRFVMVHTTAGEQGEIREGFPATRETLGAIRMAEDEAAWRALGRSPDRHEWLGFPDGGVPDVPFEELVTAIARIIHEEQPAVVATFGPDGITGHPDHITTGAATDRAFAQVRARGGSGLRRLVHNAIPQSVFDGWNHQRAEHGLRPHDPTRPYQLRGVPDEHVSITVEWPEMAGRVVAGLREHKSQLHVIVDDADNIGRWERQLGRDWWAIAWPARHPGAPMLTDVFDGLE
jgi:LmbE family N-acetylglucosaminyl deacetylase